MAGDFGKQIGRLHIRVLPNADKFRQELRKDLEAIQRGVKLEVPVTADTDQADRDVKAFVRRWSKQVIRVRVSATTAVARTQLAVLSRDRKTKLTVTVDNKALVAAEVALARLSGFRVARDLLDRFSTSLQDLDKKALSIGRVALLVANLTNVVAGAAVGLVTVASDLVKIGNLGLVLPAAFAGAAIGVTTLVIALKSAKTELAAIGPAYSALQGIIQSNFWEQAKQPILDLANSVLPSLRTGFASVAQGIGIQLGTLAGAFQRTLGGGVLDGMFLKLRETIDIVTTGMNPLAEALTTLGTVGSQYLPRLATFFVQIGTAFNNWVQESAANGDLFKFIEEGITAAKDLGRAISGIVGIFSAINTAATNAGAGGLTSFADNLQGAAAILNSPAVQGALTTILSGVATGLSGLGGGISSLGSTLVALAPVIGTVLATAGQALGAFITALSTAFAQPEFAQGLLDLFDGIYSAIMSLAPAFPALGQLFGQLASTVGLFLSSVAPLLAVIKTTFAPLFDALLVAIQPLIPVFAGVLVEAVSALVPIVTSLSSAISSNTGFFTGLIGAVLVGGTAISGATKAFGLFKAGLGGVRSGLLAISSGLDTARLIAMYGGDLVRAITKAGTATKLFMGIQKAYAVVQGIVTAAVKVFNAALRANPIGLIITAIGLLVAGLIWFFTQTETGKAVFQTLSDAAGVAFKFIGDLVGTIVEWVSQNWQLLLAILLGPFGLLVGFIITNFDLIRSVITTFIDNVVALWNAFWSGLFTIVMTVWAVIVLAVQTYINLVVAVITAVVAVIQGVWNAFWTGLATIVSIVWTAIVTVVTSYINLVVGVIQTVLSTIAAIWSAIWTGITTVVTAVWAGIQRIVQAAITFVRTVIQNVMGIIQAIWTGNWSAIGGYVQNILNAARNFISSVLNTIRGVISSVMGAVLGVWSSIWNSILNAVSSVANGVRGFISGLVGSVSDAITGVFSTVQGIQQKVISVFANAASWLRESGGKIIQGLVDGITGAVGKVKAAVGNVMEAARNLLPFSPAKEGPFSGKGWTLYSGRSISEALGQGIVDNTSKVRAAAQKMVEAVPKSVGTTFSLSDSELPASARRGDGGTREGDTYNFGDGYDAQDIIREVNMKKKQKLVKERIDAGVPLS